MQLSTSCAVNPDTDVAVKQIISMQLGTSCAFKNLIFIMHIIIFHIRNSVRVVLLKAPRWLTSLANVGLKWPYEMNPERVQLFHIYHIIGRNKTRTGFENHTLPLPRGRLVPRQPRALKSITSMQLHCRLISRLLSCHTFKNISATQLRCRLISRLLSCHTFKSITTTQLLHEKCLIVQYNLHCYL